MPAQHINILTLGSPTGTGVFFPNGLNGVIKTPAGFNLTDPGTASFYKAVPSGQVRKTCTIGFSGYRGLELHELCATAPATLHKQALHWRLMA